MYLRHLYHPERFHGDGVRPPFFEGWYFKLVTADAAQAIAIIPGVHVTENQSHAFIQLFDSQTGKAVYHRFPLDAFHAARKGFDLRVGANRFSAQGIELDLANDDQSVRGRIAFSSFCPWPIRLFSPGAMGRYAWAPFMQCYHAVLSFEHALQGALCMGNQTIDFSGGRGYAEKDWGHGFPSAYIWMQCNHFQQAGVSLSLSIAVIPWLRRSFTGLLAGLWIDRKLIRLTTYTGARVEKLAIEPAGVETVIANRRYRLSVKAHSGKTVVLQGPKLNDMGRSVKESLSARIEVHLEDRHTGQRFFSGNGHSAALEIEGGQQDLFVSDLSREKTAGRGWKRAGRSKR
ncbi:hypothetical protein JW992_09660 [candidate division KSB1 bacterium]|nr:hypothetical protein [candidate division KSB1 bacterium]